MKEYKEMLQAVGVVPPCVTMFDDTGAIDYEATRAHVDWLIESGVDGLLAIGTCGEFYALAIDERERLAESFVEWVQHRVPLYIGVMHTSTETAVRLAKHAEKAGATGVMSVSPYYSSPPEREVLQYFRDIRSAIDLPLIVYNNPGASGVSLSVHALASLAADGTASMIKESHGDPSRIHDLRLVVPETTPLLYGEDYGAFEALAVGADGWVAGIGNMIPHEAVELWRLIRTEELTAARRQWFRMLPLVNMTSHKPMFGRADERPDFIQIYKAALDAIGRRGGPCRRPLLPLTAEDQVYLEGLLAQLGVTDRAA